VTQPTMANSVQRPNRVRTLMRQGTLPAA
jgi:hypothetical protein